MEKGIFTAILFTGLNQFQQTRALIALLMVGALILIGGIILIAHFVQQRRDEKGFEMHLRESDLSYLDEGLND